MCFCGKLLLRYIEKEITYQLSKVHSIHLFLVLYILFYVFECFVYKQVCAPYVFTILILGGQKWATGPLELQLQNIPNPVPLHEQQVLLTIDPSSLQLEPTAF